MAAVGPFGRSVVQNPIGQGKPATVIFLHGIGDSGSGIIAIGEALRNSSVPNISHVKCASFLFLKRMLYNPLYGQYTEKAHQFLGLSDNFSRILIHFVTLKENRHMISSK